MWRESVSCFVALASTTPTPLKARLRRGSPHSFASLSFGAMSRRLGPTLPRVKSFTMWSLCFFWGFCLSSSFPDFELGAISQRRYRRSLQQARRRLDRGDHETPRDTSRAHRYKNQNKNTLITGSPVKYLVFKSDFGGKKMCCDVI